MKREEVMATVLEITDLISRYGYAEFAAQLKEQADVLADRSASQAAVDEAYGRLRRSIHGMGGLLDLWFRAPTKAESVAAGSRLESLCDELWRLNQIALALLWKQNLRSK